MSINTLLTASSVVMRTFMPLAPGLYRPSLPTHIPHTPTFEAYEWLAVPTLTSLTLMCNKQKITLTECICVVTLEKNIVQTALQGRNGTIKEYISNNDYQIEIAGGIVGECDQYPQGELRDLMKMLQANDPILVGDDSFLSLFGITNLVVKSYAFQQQTHSNRQGFTLWCLSDTANESKLKQDKLC